MSELPDRCICGYQGKIDRLEALLSAYSELWLEQREQVESLLEGMLDHE